MGKLRKIGKKIGRGIKSVGKKLKSGLGKVAKAFGKLGPLGSIALSFILPGIGSWISSVAQGSSFIAPIAQGLVNAGKFVKNGIGKVFNKVTDAIEYSMNKVSSIGGEGVAGSNFRNWASEQTNGFIDKSTVGLEDKVIPGGQGTILNPDGTKTTFQRKDTVLTPDQQVGNFKNAPKVPKTPKGMTDPVYMDGAEGGLKKGFYEQADVDTYFKGIDTTVDITSGKVVEGVATGPLPQGQTSIKTTGDLKAPKPKGGGYFGRAKDVYKYVGPVTVAGMDIQAEEDAEIFAKQQQQAFTRDYFSSIGQDLLASGNSNPNISVIDFNNPNPSNNDVYNLVNSYGGILGTTS